MANLLTGDYEAVLQVSEGTLNRLLASMHQNAWRDPKTPSFPHSVGVRLGRVVEVDGVRGMAWAQASVPRMTLINGATDRFLLDVGLRIRYVPDPGTEPLPTSRLGCLMNGCCAGRTTTGPLGMWLPNIAGHRHRRYPTQLLESGWAAIVLTAALASRDSLSVDGVLFAGIVGLYCAGRMWLEALREESHAPRAVMSLAERLR